MLFCQGYLDFSRHGCVYPSYCGSYQQLPGGNWELHKHVWKRPSPSQAASDDKCIGNSCWRFQSPSNLGYKGRTPLKETVRISKKPRTGSAEDCAWQSRGHVNLESSLPVERCLTFTCIVSSSCAKAKGSGHSCLRAQTRLRRALFSEGLDAWELALMGLALPPSDGVCWCCRRVSVPGGLSLRKRFVGVSVLAGGSCACFGFACNGPQNKISCSTEKTLLAVAGGIGDF